MPDPAGYWDEYKEFALGLPYSVEDYEQSDVDVWLMDGNGLNIAMVGHASDPDLGERVGEFIVRACNSYHGHKKKIEELHKLLATRGRHCHTCKFCEEVEPCALGCVHDDGEKACTADDEDPYRNWTCAVDNGSARRTDQPTKGE